MPEEKKEYEFGYKGFKYDFSSMGRKYEINKYQKVEINNEKEIFKKGIRYFKDILDIFDYYPINQNNRYAMVDSLKVSQDFEKYDFKIPEKIKDGSIKITTEVIPIKEYSVEDMVFYTIPNTRKDLKLSDKESEIVISDEKSGYASSSSKNNHIVISKNKNSVSECYDGDYNISVSDGDNSISSMINNSRSVSISMKKNSISASKNSKDGILITNGNDSRCYVGRECENIKAFSSGSSVCLESVSSGNNILCGMGPLNIAKGKKDNWIVLAEYEFGNIINIKSVKIDNINFKEDTYYKLENGIFKEVDFKDMNSNSSVDG